MALTLSNAARSAMMDALTALADAGEDPGLLRIYSGTRPAGPDTAVTDQDLLAEFDLADPAFGSASNGVATLDADPDLETTGLGAGTATWWRLLDSEEHAIADGSITATGGGGDITLNTTTISVGVNVVVTTGTLTMPAGSA